MSRQEPPQLNQAYQAYKENPAEVNYDVFGSALMTYVRAIILKQYGTRFRDADDIVQEVCLEIIKDMSSPGVTIEDFANWAYGVTRHTCIDNLRQRERQQEEELEAASTIVYETGPSVEQKVDLEILINKLEQADQELVEMKMHGMSNEEIAAELDISVDSVKGRWKRIVERLRTLGVDK